MYWKGLQESLYHVFGLPDVLRQVFIDRLSNDSQQTFKTGNSKPPFLLSVRIVTVTNLKFLFLKLSFKDKSFIVHHFLKMDHWMISCLLSLAPWPACAFPGRYVKAKKLSNFDEENFLYIKSGT